MVNGIRSYFNVMLGPQLLYECERKQYTEVSVITYFIIEVYHV